MGYDGVVASVPAMEGPLGSASDSVETTPDNTEQYSVTNRVANVSAGLDTSDSNKTESSSTHQTGLSGGW